MQSVSQLLLTFVLNACWQIALVTVAAALCAWLLRGTSARHKHLLWVAALALALCLPVWTIARLSGLSFFRGQPGRPNTVTPRTSDSRPAPQLISSDAAIASPTSVQETKPAIPINGNFAVVLAALYLLFLCYRSIKLLRAWLRVRAIVRSASPIELPEHVQAIIGRCQTSLGVTQVRVLCSPSVTVPVTVGSLTRLVILPEPLLREADVNVLTSAIGHELAHIRRRDYLLNLIYEFISLPFSFHPAAALVKRRIQETRELRCDELVTERLLDAEVYARSLVQLASSALPLGRHTTTITVGIIDADILEERVMSMLRRPQINVRRKNLLLMAAALCFVVPCAAAAPFALRVSINPQDATQETKQKEEPGRVVFITPTLEANAEAGTLVAWLKKPGDTVERGEAIAKVETSKGLMEVEAVASGTVERLMVQIGEKAPVGAVLATIREPGQSASKEVVLQEWRRGVAFNFVPEGWLQAEGQIQAVNVTPQEGTAQDAQQKATWVLQADRVRLENGEKVVSVQTDDGPVTLTYNRLELQGPEVITWRIAGREKEAKQQAELAKQANLTMQQAIQIAMNEHFGKVLESRLVREREQACYVITILSDNGVTTTTTRVLLSAIDGHVINTFKEDHDPSRHLDRDNHDTPDNHHDSRAPKRD